MNQLVFGADLAEASLLRWLDTCEIFELFCDGMRFGIGLALGVERRRLVAISIACGGGIGSKISTSMCLCEISDLLDVGDGDFFFELIENSSFIC